MKTSKSTKLRWMPLTIAFLLSACAGSPKVELANTEKNSSAMTGAAEKVLIMGFYPEDDMETRVVIENALVSAFRKEGVDADPGFRVFENYLYVEQNVEQLKKGMDDGGYDALVIIDPIRLKEFSNEEWYAQRNAYRALGMDNAATINMFRHAAAEADAAKVEMDVLVWDRGSEQFTWHSEYDMNLPGAYELNSAKTYADEFGTMVATQLRSEGLVR